MLFDVQNVEAVPLALLCHPILKPDRTPELRDSRTQVLVAFEQGLYIPEPQSSGQKHTYEMTGFSN